MHLLNLACQALCTKQVLLAVDMCSQLLHKVPTDEKLFNTHCMQCNAYLMLIVQTTLGAFGLAGCKQQGLVL